MLARKGNPSALLVARQSGAATVKTVWSFLKRLKVELSFDPVILLLGIHHKNPKTLIRKNIWMPMFIVMLFTIAKIWKLLKCPSIDE